MAEPCVQSAFEQCDRTKKGCGTKNGGCEIDVNMLYLEIQ